MILIGVFLGVVWLEITGHKESIDDEVSNLFLDFFIPSTFIINTFIFIIIIFLLVLCSRAILNTLIICPSS